MQEVLEGYCCVLPVMLAVIAALIATFFVPYVQSHPEQWDYWGLGRFDLPESFVFEWAVWAFFLPFTWPFLVAYALGGVCFT
jgi:hypothetical protein